jgi:hypothetical protein
MMPIQIKWYNDEKTILLETFESGWTVEDYRHLIDEAAQYLATVDHTVHIIVDGSHDTSHLPINMLRGGLAYAVRNVPPNQGITVFVGIDSVSEMFLGIARNVNLKLSRSLFSTDNLSKALQIVERYAFGSE